MTVIGIALCVYAAALLASGFLRSAHQPEVTRLVWER